MITFAVMKTSFLIFILKNLKIGKAVINLMAFLFYIVFVPGKCLFFTKVSSNCPYFSPGLYS